MVKNSNVKFRKKRDVYFPVGRCDASFQIVKHKDLAKQYEYAGKGLVDTGMMVYKKLLDKPNPQNLAPKIKIDPMPVRRARPDPFYNNPQPMEFYLEIKDLPEYILTLNEFQNVKFIFFGDMTQDVVIKVPATFNIFSTINNTLGTQYKLTIMLVNAFNNVYELYRNKIQYFNCTGNELLFLRSEPKIGDM